MNILIISTGILPQPAVKGGAVETLIDTLIEYNEKLKENSLKVYTVYDEKAISHHYKYKNCEFVNIKINEFIKKLFYKGICPTRIILRIFTNKIIKDIKKNMDFDLILLENEFRYVGKIKKITGEKPIILHMHNDYINKDIRSIKKKISSFNSIITVSDFLAKRIKEVNKSVQVQTIHNGISLTKFKRISKTERKELRKRYNISEDEIVVVFAGRLIKEKGIKELLIAFNQLPRNINIKLLIIGDSFFEGSRESIFIKELKRISKNNKSKIIFTGFVNYSEIYKIYSIADIGCVPSIWDEPFGLTIIEQMAIGLPIIVSKVGAIPEIVNEEVALLIDKNEDYIINLKNALIKLYYNEELRYKMGQSGIKLVENFSDSNFCEKVYSYLKKEYNNINYKNYIFRKEL